MKTIDLTPTWGEWGNIYRRFAESGETAAIRELRRDFARVCAAAQALKEIVRDESQEAAIGIIYARELAKQGFRLSDDMESVTEVEEEMS